MCEWDLAWRLYNVLGPTFDLPLEIAMLRLTRSLPLIACVLMSTGFTARSVGQVPGSSSSRTVIIGQVIDTMTGAALADAEVLVIKDSIVVSFARSNARGKVSLSALPSSGRYSILVRKVGYAPLRRADVRFLTSDTIALRFGMQPFISSLTEVVAHRYYECDAVFSPCEAGQETSLFWERLSQQSSPSNIPEDRARDLAKRIQKAARRIEDARGAGGRPEPNDILFVRDAAQVCSGGVPTDDEFFVLCRELVKRIPRTKLERLAQALSAMDGAN